MSSTREWNYKSFSHYYINHYPFQKKTNMYLNLNWSDNHSDKQFFYFNVSKQMQKNVLIYLFPYSQAGHGQYWGTTTIVVSGDRRWRSVVVDDSVMLIVVLDGRKTVVVEDWVGRGGQGGQLVVTLGVDKTGFVKTLSKTSAVEVNENLMSETRSCKKFVSISPFIFRISRSLYTRTGRAVTCLKRFNFRALIFQAWHYVGVWTLGGS